MFLQPWLLSLIIVWIFIILVLALVILRALRRQRHLRHAYLRAMEHHAAARAARLHNESLLYHPTLSPRGLTKEEVDIAAPLAVTIPDAVFLDEQTTRALAAANRPAQDLSVSFATITSVALSEIAAEPVTCSICLDDVAPGERRRVIRRCGHVYHSKCIRNWLRRENKCPNCQQEALEKARQQDVEMQIVTRVRHLTTVQQPRRPFPMQFLHFLARKRTHRTHVAASNSAHGGARISFERRARARSAAAAGAQRALASPTLWNSARVDSGSHDLEVDVESGLMIAGEESVDEVLTRMNTV